MPLRNPFLRPHPLWHCVLASVALVVAIAWLLPGDLFLSAPSTDLVGQLAAWRAFAADNILAGHFPLWNPYTYAGQPFLGDFQSAELYPPNVIFLFLPLVRACNLCFLLHLLLMGWGVWFWLGRRGYHPGAAALAGLALALSGPVFPRLYAGHLASVCTMAWAPWTFWALEAAWRGPWKKPVLLAAAFVALQVLGGFPQYVAYVAVAAGVYAVVISICEPTLRRRALPILAGVYLAGALLAAAQLLPGYAAIGESYRAGKLPYDFVKSSSFPPENFVTVLAPWFFGAMPVRLYWGRDLLWETTLFAGVSGLALALLAPTDSLHGRQARRDWLVIAVLLLLALGDHTPLLRLLYDHVPTFDKFRSPSKFAFPLMLFAVAALGAGADAVIRGRLGSKIFSVALVAGGLGAAGAGLYLCLEPNALDHLFLFIQHSRETFLPLDYYTQAQFIEQAGPQAGWSLALGGVLLAAVGGALLLARWWPRWRWAPLGLLPVEMVCFAWFSVGTAHLADLKPEAFANYIAAHPGDYRVLLPIKQDNGYFFGVSVMTGDDPTALKRYVEFIFASQKLNPDEATQILPFSQILRIFSLVRFRYAFVPIPEQRGQYAALANPDPLPHALLVQNYQVRPARDTIFSELLKKDFNPRQMVLLESEPNPKPQPGASAGTVRLTEVNSDQLAIEADTPAPALLLITDLYSKDWRARALPDSAQQRYEILPADYIVRAIPLGAGHHHLMMEYAPPSFRWGLAISGLAWLGWVGLFVFTARSVRKNALI